MINLKEWFDSMVEKKDYTRMGIWISGNRIPEIHILETFEYQTFWIKFSDAPYDLKPNFLVQCSGHV